MIFDVDAFVIINHHLNIYSRKYHVDLDLSYSPATLCCSVDQSKVHIDSQPPFVGALMSLSKFTILKIWKIFIRHFLLVLILCVPVSVENCQNLGKTWKIWLLIGKSYGFDREPEVTSSQGFFALYLLKMYFFWFQTVPFRNPKFMYAIFNGGF